ncbi:hypothetical protein [Arthrobacter sp. OAP107]|uniref:hypothetical protein n=1 Tax=Arthrobacter sp. OAP107 TaxID=3156445 RepID=UPI003394BD9D
MIRTLQPGQHCEVWVASATGERELVYGTGDILLEAPNWTLDVRFPSGTQGHPADLPVDVVLVSTDDWAAPLQTWPLVGGQGTLNVNSWAPDSGRLAYVAYPPANSNPAED